MNSKNWSFSIIVDNILIKVWLTLSQHEFPCECVVVWCFSTPIMLHNSENNVKVKFVPLSVMSISQHPCLQITSSKNIRAASFASRPYIGLASVHFVNAQINTMINLYWFDSVSGPITSMKTFSKGLDALIGFNGILVL